MADLLLYDGQCPICAGSVAALRLRETLPGVRILDARAESALVVAYRGRGFEINDGLILDLGGAIHHGADAVTAIAALTGRSRWLNRAAAWVFRSPRVTAVLYPPMAWARTVLLRLLGRRGIG